VYRGLLCDIMLFESCFLDRMGNYKPIPLEALPADLVDSIVS
jgi:hypothetical protein